jgi:hypothetical protein
MTTFTATPRHLSAASHTRHASVKAFIRRLFELAGAPYADSAYQPL